MASPRATGVRYLALTSSDAASISGTVPSLFTAGMSEDDEQPRASSSMTIAAAIASAPAPPYASGTCTACRSALTRASCTSQGNSAVRSTSAARGAILSSAMARTDSRRARCSSESAKAGKSAVMARWYGGPSASLLAWPASARHRLLPLARSCASRFAWPRVSEPAPAPQSLPNGSLTNRALTRWLPRSGATGVVTMQERGPQPMAESRVDRDEQQAAREWADEQAERIGQIWLRRFPRGRDW